MKKTYSKPVIEIETFTLSEAIAQTCDWTVDAGPSDHWHTSCHDLDSYFQVSAASLMNGTSFYNDGEQTYYQCDCYYTAGGESFFTS